MWYVFLPIVLKLNSYAPKGRVRKINIGTLILTKKEKKLVNEVLDSNRLSYGKYSKLFEEKKNWRKAAQQAQKRWGIPIGISMAFIHQESGFQANAKPDRRKFLWIIPCPICSRKSTSYGYAQAVDETWKQYVKEAGDWLPDRSDFDDAIDFIGWYNHQSNKKLGIARSNAKALYLAYHEGQNGYRNGTFRKKTVAY